MKKFQFGFWNTEESDDGSGWWMLFDSLEDAATEANGREIFSLKAESLGYYTLEVKRVLKKKKRKVNKNA